jgi:hypothetical protein
MPERVKNGQTALERRLRFTFDISPVGAGEKRAGILRSAAHRGGDFEQKACFVKSSRQNRLSELFGGWAEIASLAQHARGEHLPCTRFADMKM